MAEWTDLEVTWRTATSPPPDGTLYLPPGKPATSPIVIRTTDDREILAKAIHRPGYGGTGAIATGSLYEELAGTEDSAAVRYRKATVIDRFRLKPMLMLQLTVVVLTLVAAIIDAWAGFLATRADPSTEFAAKASTLVLLLALVGASWKFYEDFKLD